MQWTDEGIVLGVKRHGEANAVLELMTREHGRHLGLVRGGFGSRLKPVLQPGNTVNAIWRARLDEHLGNYTVEGLDLRAASFFSAPHAIYGVSHLAALMRLLPERDPHAGLYEALDDIFAHLNDASVAAPMVVRFELQSSLRARLRPRSRTMRGDGRLRDLGLCLAEIRPRGVAHRRRAVGRQDAAPAGLPARSSRPCPPAAILPTVLR